MRMAEFAWRVRNQVRPLGAAALGLPCQLMGTGMAFPWVADRDARRSPAATSSRTCSSGSTWPRAGAPPLLLSGSARHQRVRAATREGAAAQRTRWEHGHLAVIVASGLPLLWQALRRRRLALFALALDLCVPPLACARARRVARRCRHGRAGRRSEDRLWPLAVAALTLVLISVSMLRAWQRHGRDLLSFAELLSAPLYVALKIPFYLRMLVRRQTTWVRTHRGPAPQEVTHRVGPRP